MHKLYLVIVIVLVPVFGFGQNTGTLKVSKETPKKSGFALYSNATTTLAGKSTPQLIRENEVLLGTNIGRKKDYHSRFLGGIAMGSSYPSENHKGFGAGLFVEFNYRVLIGPTQVLLPRFQLSYKRQFNTISEFKNWNQYSAGLGFSINIPNKRLWGLQLTFMGHYRFDEFSSYNKKGVFPTVGVAFFR